MTFDFQAITKGVFSTLSIAERPPIFPRHNLFLPRFVDFSQADWQVSREMLTFVVSNI